LEVLASRESRNPELGSFYNYDPAQILRETFDALWESLNFIQELIFEEVRQQSFRDMPSKQGGLWSIPEDPDALQYWWNAIGATDRGRLYRAQATGKTHVEAEQFLNSETSTTVEWRKMIQSYWKSVGMGNPANEVLFVGRLAVVEEMSASTDGV